MIRVLTVLSLIGSAVFGFGVGVAITVWREVIRPTRRTGDDFPPT